MFEILNIKKTNKISPRDIYSMQGAGVELNGRRYITHTTLEPKNTAASTFILWQKLSITILILLICYGLISKPLWTLTIIAGFLSFVYFLDVLFNLFLIIRSLGSPPDIIFSEDELNSLDENKLPLYTILCPLYQEAKVVGRFIQSIEKLDWPTDKLDVILLLEEDDKETQRTAYEHYLPSYIRPVIVPHSLPKTKPKACNWGLSLAKGEFLVIYDAEDIPEPNQLKKAFLGFAKVPRNVICLQAKLNFYNPYQNILTRLFTAEYSLWFDVILPGLQSVQTCIPLGGTSNHFRIDDLLKLEGWDAFNVTEDADLGVRLFRAGYKTAIFDSTTLEEANSQLGNWVRQRSRWVKGYIQTYLVHTRNPVAFINQEGIHAIFFHILLGGRIAFMFINPILWIVTFSYFALNGLVGETIEAVYPGFVLYIAVTSFIVGNFMFIYYYMVGCAKRLQWSIIRYSIFVPFYWVLISCAACVAIYQLIFKPHYWEKTKHGLDVPDSKSILENYQEKDYSIGTAFTKEVVLWPAR